MHIVRNNNNTYMSYVGDAAHMTAVNAQGKLLNKSQIWNPI